jgi:hypothetical protein
MIKYLSAKPIWFKPTPKINALNEKSLCILQGTDVTLATLRIHGPDPDGFYPGQCAVIAWHTWDDRPDDEPWSGASAAPPIAGSRYWQRFLSQTALDLMRPHNDPSLPESNFLLWIRDEEESPDL